MPCCGNQRRQIQAARPVRPGSPAAGPPSPSQAREGNTVYFRYFGQTGLTVTGPASSRMYKFGANSDRIAVDSRDAAALSRVPNLRMVRTS